MGVQWIDRFQGLMGLSPEVRQVLVNGSEIVRLREGAVIFGPDKAPETLLLLLSGTVRVQQLSEQGREIVLYRVHAGQSCVMTTACLLAYEDYSAEGIAESEVEAAAIPKQLFDDLVAQSKEFREFVLSAYSRRVTDLFKVIEEIAFQRMDIRLAEKLLELRGDDGRIVATHQQMAAELGTAREVVSRQLNEFQRRGWIELARGVIRIVEPEALRGLSGSAR